MPPNEGSILDAKRDKKLNQRSLFYTGAVKIS
jgi:hypothetical protein